MYASVSSMLSFNGDIYRWVFSFYLFSINWKSFPVCPMRPRSLLQILVYAIEQIFFNLSIYFFKISICIKLLKIFFNESFFKALFKKSFQFFLLPKRIYCNNSGRTFVRLHGILQLMENSCKIRKQPSDLILLHWILKDQHSSIGLHFWELALKNEEALLNSRRIYQNKNNQNPAAAILTLLYCFRNILILHRCTWSLRGIWGNCNLVKNISATRN